MKRFGGSIKPVGTLLTRYTLASTPAAVYSQMLPEVNVFEDVHHLADH